ncbi:FMN-dependent NADH-azoreductase [Metamycoplasma equirhinis]|uniref:FMN-dependent NADH-azoreductase n=1 Tax=Metamycoplasma equirhinis TaxID=92402 RepID=UPI00359491DC
MNKIIALYSSPINEEKSISSNLTNLFVENYLELNSNDELLKINLNDEKIGTEVMTSHSFVDVFGTESEKWIDMLKSTNKLIISMPMINFNVPTVLKNFFDHICVANKTFSYKYSNKGDAIGLLSNLKVQIIATQGAPIDWYQWGLFVNYVEGTCKFLGMKVMPSIMVSGVKTKPLNEKNISEIKEIFAEKIKKAAQDF